MKRLAVVLLAACPLAVNAEPLLVFDGAAVAPFGLFIGDKKGWAIPVTEPEAVTNGDYLSIRPGAEAGVKTATWSGKGEAQLYFGSPEPQDMIGLIAQDAALVALLQLHALPNRKVTLRLGCGESCSANADVGRLFKALPTDEWLRVSFDLKCFAEGGLDAKKVVTPFLLLTRGRLSLSLADVRLVPGAGPAATVKCR